MNTKLEATEIGIASEKIQNKAGIGHKFQVFKFSRFQERKKLWMTFARSLMATLFSPTKRIMQEGDLVIIWIVRLSSNLPAHSVEPQYSPTNNA